MCRVATNTKFLPGFLIFMQLLWSAWCCYHIFCLHSCNYFASTKRQSPICSTEQCNIWAFLLWLSSLLLGQTSLWFGCSSHKHWSVIFAITFSAPKLETVNIRWLILWIVFDILCESPINDKELRWELEDKNKCIYWF